MIRTQLNWDALGQKVQERAKKTHAHIEQEKRRMESIFESQTTITTFYNEVGIHAFLNTVVTAAQVGILVDWKKVLFMVRPEHRDDVMYEMLAHARSISISVDEMRELFTRPDQLELFQKFCEYHYNARNNPGGAFPTNDLVAFADLPEPMVLYLMERFDFSLVWRQIAQKPNVSIAVKNELFKRHAKNWLAADTLPAFDELVNKLFPEIEGELRRVARFVIPQ